MYMYVYVYIYIFLLDAEEVAIWGLERRCGSSSGCRAGGNTFTPPHRLGLEPLDVDVEVQALEDDHPARCLALQDGYLMECVGVEDVAVPELEGDLQAELARSLELLASQIRAELKQTPSLGARTLATNTQFGVLILGQNTKRID